MQSNYPVLSQESFKAIWSYEPAIKLGLCVHFSWFREWNRISHCVQQEREGLGRREYAGSLYLASPRHLFWERIQLSLQARRSRSCKDLTLWILPWSRPSALPNGVTGVQMGLWDTLNIWRDMHCMTVIYENTGTQRSTRAYSMRDKRMKAQFGLCTNGDIRGCGKKLGIAVYECIYDIKGNKCTVGTGVRAAWKKDGEGKWDGCDFLRRGVKASVVLEG